MKPQSLERNMSPSRLLMHDDSHKIFKAKPKIRIIHIVAPEIIKTNAEHFRELVQRLTGQPVEKKGSMRKDDVSSHSETHVSKPKKNTEPVDDSVLQNTKRVKKEDEEIYGGENPNAFFNYLGEVDGFIQDMNEFPLFNFRSSQINKFGEMPLC